MLYDPKWEKKIAPSDVDVYSAAAEAIERYGHSKGLMKNSQGAMCLFGAISYVLSGDARTVSFRAHDLTKALTPLCGGDSPVKWNNAEERTKDEVVSVLRRAALPPTK